MTQTAAEQYVIRDSLKLREADLHFKQALAEFQRAKVNLTTRRNSWEKSVDVLVAEYEKIQRGQS